jgi:D-glycero-D-manno-heptose 1,7-bisphosphate phosphatase
MVRDTKAVFLDRDGVLIHEVQYLSDLKDIELFTDVPESLKQLREAGYLLIMVSNQSGVARGYFDEDFVKRANAKLNRLLRIHGAELDHMYYCPHHPLGNPPYNVACDCRKPAPGLVIDSIQRFSINPLKSYMIGDKLCDISLARNSLLEGLLVRTGHGNKECQKVIQSYPETAIFNTFAEATSHILQSPVN